MLKSAEKPTEILDISRELRWVEKHREQYAGQWVALDGDQLVSSGPDATAVYEEAVKAGVKSPFLKQIEPHHESRPFGGW